MKTYQEIKKSSADELNKFDGLFFAFSNNQFDEGMKKIGLSKTDTDKICSIGAGGYILKSQVKSFQNMFKRHKQALKDLRNNERELISAIAYELANHEYCITGDVTEALNVLELTKDDVNPKIIKEAISLSY